MQQTMDLYGQALMDYYGGNEQAALIIHRDDGVEASLPIAVFFRAAEELDIDRLALTECTGPVLDVGAGTGTHALWLQEKGLRVCALDISPQACEIMRKLGVHEVVCADMTQWKTAEKFDTVLILGRSIGAVGSLHGLSSFLRSAHSLVQSGGKILLNSFDVRCTQEARHLEYQTNNTRRGKYFGEICMCFEYKGEQGQFINYLHVDSETLIRVSAECNWNCTVLTKDHDGNFLAKLTDVVEGIR